MRSIDIVDGAVQSVDIRNGGVAPTDLAGTSLGRSSRLWAQISSSGSRIRGPGVVVVVC